MTWLRLQEQIIMIMIIKVMKEIIIVMKAMKVMIMIMKAMKAIIMKVNTKTMMKIK